MDDCFEQAQEIACEIKGIGIEAQIGSMDGLKANLEKFAEWGVTF